MSDEHMLQPTTNDQTLSAFKSQFYKEYAQPDYIAKIFPREVMISIDDISDLIDIVNERFRQYKNEGYIIEAHVKFLNRREIHFSTWSEFENHSWGESSPINRIVITFTANVVIPNKETPNKHILRVKLTNGMRPDEMFRMMLQGDFDEYENIESNMVPIYARVDFTERQLGDDLVSSVEEWVKGLEKPKISSNSFVMWLKKYNGIIAKILKNLTHIVGLFVSSVVFLYLINGLDFEVVSAITKEQLNWIAMYLFILAGIWIFISGISKAIANFIHRLLVDYGQTHIFDITKGDKKAVNKLNHEQAFKLIGILISFSGTIILDVIITVFTAMLF